MSNILNVSDLRSLISGSRRVDIDNSPHDESVTSRILSRLTLVPENTQSSPDVQTFTAPSETSERLIVSSPVAETTAQCNNYFAVNKLSLDVMGSFFISTEQYEEGSLLYSFHLHNYSFISDSNKRLIESKIDEIISSMRTFNPCISRDSITIHDARILVKKLKISLFRNFSWIALNFNIQTKSIILYIEYASSYEDSEYADPNHYLRVIKHEDCDPIPECIISTVSEYLSALDKHHLSLFTEEEHTNFEDFFDEYASRWNIEFRSYLDDGIISLVIDDIGNVEDHVLEPVENNMSISESSNRVLSLLRSSLIDDKSKVKEKEEDKKEKIIFKTMEDRVKYIFDSAQDFEEFKESPILKKLEEARTSSFLSREEVIAFAESDIEERIEKYKKDLLIHNRKPMKASIRNIRLLPQVQIVTYF